MTGRAGAEREAGTSRASEPRTAGEMLALARCWLAEKELAEARLDAELLVAEALGRTRLGLFLELDRPVDAAEVARARELLVRRAAGEPTAYLIGKREFYGRDFAVRPGVLIPRPETELLVDLAREHAADWVVGEGRFEACDLGTGSGCLAITLALELPRCRVHAVEVSEEALAVARENALALEASVRFLRADAAEALGSAFPDGLDLVVCNPPYVDPAGRDALPVEVREHEPALALFAPEGRPDHWVELVLDAAVPRLREGGVALVELGFDQADRARELALARGLEPRLHRDMAGIERVLELRPAAS